MRKKKIAINNGYWFKGKERKENNKRIEERHNKINKHLDKLKKIRENG